MFHPHFTPVKKYAQKSEIFIKAHPSKVSWKTLEQSECKIVRWFQSEREGEEFYKRGVRMRKAYMNTSLKRNIIKERE
jgi:hypothetical protein